MKNKKKFLSALFLMGLAFLPGNANADLTITPTLVLIEGRSRFSDISVVNSGEVPATYQLDWVYYQMEESTGFYKKIDKSLTEFDLPAHLALTPKRMTLSGSTVQKIRMGLRLKGEPPPPGDYRAHLHIQEAPLEVAQGANPQKGASVGVKVNVGFTIPVVYRVGQSDATAQIGNVTTQINQNGKIEVSIPVTKSGGNFGLLGNMSIYYDGKVVGQVKNANIFSEAKNRTFKVPLNVDKLSGGELRIVYRDFNAKKNLIFAEKKVPISR
jgi:P pilus assembly chaperone PapD